MKIFEKAISHFQSNLPFVLYVKPNENKLKGLFQQDDSLHTFTNQKGFVFASFDGEKQIVITKEDSESFSEIIQWEADYTIASLKISSTVEQKNAFESLVEKAVEVIKQAEFDKLVVSRKIDFSNQIDVFQSYKNLVKKYPTAFCYLFFHPKIGMWMGATPEQLIKINGNQFETVALAGTQLFSDDLNWTQKEVLEQQFVTDFIVSNIRPFVSEVEVSKPFTIQAGKLAHIKTEISGNLLNTSKAVDLIIALHPTPAVCGLPKEKAKHFIIANEGYNRKFYAGYIGEWNIENKVDLFVNLRCIEIGESNSIYVGCGITKDSVAEKEFFETENKSETIKQILIERNR